MRSRIQEWEDIGAVLASLRKFRDLSQESLCKRIHIGRTRLSGIEGGKLDIPMRTFLDILLYLAADFDLIVSCDKEREFKPPTRKKIGRPRTKSRDSEEDDDWSVNEN